MHFDDFLQQACPPLDLDWRKYRRRSARHRVLARITELDLKGFTEYLDRLHSDPGEANGLAELMAVTVSRFFREASRWEDLQERVLPHLLASSPGRDRLRVWSVGCAGGEEPYSLVLLWQYRLQAGYPWRRLSMLASDSDPVSLQRARQAVYSKSSLREVPGDLFAKGFVARGDCWRLLVNIRR